MDRSVFLPTMLNFLLYHHIKTEADGCALQGDLNSLNRWSKYWKMAFNITKCHVLHITRNRRVIIHRYNIRGTLLTPVEHHPYLGLELDNKLCLKQQLANVRSKGTCTLNMVRRNFTKGTKSDTKNQIYTSLVRPVLEHGSLVWGPYQRGAAFSPLANSPSANSPAAKGPPAKSPPPAAIRPPLA